MLGEGGEGEEDEEDEDEDEDEGGQESWEDWARIGPVRCKPFAMAAAALAPVQPPARPTIQPPFNLAPSD